MGVLKLLYVTDRFSGTDHAVHMMFLIESLDPNPLPFEWTHEDPHSSASSEPLREIKMVPCSQLESYGFGATFGQLVRDGFPESRKLQGRLRDLLRGTVRLNRNPDHKIADC